MNRLILIGNGFDLAHGMKTSYNDFILWYLKKCFEEAYENGNYDDPLLTINSSSYRNFWISRPKELLIEYLEHYFKSNVFDFFNEENIYLNTSTSNFNPFKTVVKSALLKQLLIKCRDLNWVEIENEFYIKLKEVFNMPITLMGGEDNHRRTSDLDSLNSSLKIIIQELEKYLLSFGPSASIDSYRDIFKSIIEKDNVVINNDLKEDEDPKFTLVLNFNYTTTPKKYFSADQLTYDINYIHGKVGDEKNRLIFGFGDELDENYKKLELQKSNSFFENIKSFWYFKTSNYHNLVRFIEGEEFQVYILGHSCGLSDRTMLNMIFEHENCRSIKIFYHGTKEKNNFTNLTQEISRHFKDKGMMRKKIVPFDKSEPMPQVESN